MTSRLKEKYDNEVAGYLMDKFGYKNKMQVPRLEKVILNIGLGEAKDNPKVLESAINDLTVIAGQKPVVTLARKSIANFKLREGHKIGVKVTLRGQRMYDFLDKLMNVALPRVRDFRGVKANAFDGRGNYSLGLKVADREYERNNFLIHDYFFAKTLDKVRDGDLHVKRRWSLGQC